MKIGIITQPLDTNYGGLLQNYALQQVLKQLGHEPITIDQPFPNKSLWRIWASWIKTFMLKLIGKGKNRKYISCRINKKKQIYIRQNTDYFIDKYITHSKRFLSTKDFRNYTINHQLDALIVGSDQVWRPMYNEDVLRSFFNFSRGLKIKRIAYAASFGVDFWEYNHKQTKKSQDLIREFNAVSVREYSGIELCRKYLYCAAVHVLDPTMLLDKEDYISLVRNENEPVSKGNLFSYILDISQEKRQIIDQLALDLKMTQFSSMPKHDGDIFPPVTQWIRSFIDADFVVCDSFHGAVFSIIFNKPFLIIGNKERGMTRFNSLLNTFDLNERMITDIENVDSIVYSPINWDKVNRIRTELKSYSLDFLKSNLIK